ncbi:MAG: response regulator, partial [Deltaproteobacteria bacterium]|nr:response regulator [Deltaproteobacteria bacterium]
PALFVHRAQRDRIKSALEIFYLEGGAYPQKLEELVTARLIRKDDLFYRKGVSYQYEVKDGKYILKH